MQRVLAFAFQCLVPSGARSTPLTIARLLHDLISLEGQQQSGIQDAPAAHGFRTPLLHAYCTALQSRFQGNSAWPRMVRRAILARSHRKALPLGAG